MGIQRWAARALLAAGFTLASAAGIAAPTVDAEVQALEASGLARLLLDPTESTFRVPPPLEFLQKAGLEKSATVVINYLPAGDGLFGDKCSTWPQAPKAAFTYAANIWASQVNSVVPITIDACWANNMGAFILGHAGAVNVFRDFPGAPRSDTYYPSALANALRGSRIDSTAPDIYAAFNSATNWYTGTDGRTPSTQSDFASVVLHEIGHGLGFLGTMSIDEVKNQGSWGENGSPYSYDRFTENSLGQSLVNVSIFPNPSVALATQLTSTAGVYFNGTNAKAANGGARVPLYAPTAWNEGSSYSHLAESYRNTANALMTFSLSRGASIHSPGPVILGVLRDVGWPAAVSQYAVTVSKGGTGNGSVASSPTGITCGSTCTASFNAGTSLTLTATPASGSRFAGWSGTCSGTGTCVTTVSAAVSFSATFIQTAVLNITKAGSGSGTVTGTAGSINCGATCSATLDAGTPVTLTATPAAGSTFSGWTGNCSGMGSCTLTMSTAANVTASFTSTPPVAVTVAKAGSGSGNVTSTPAGIACGSSCSAAFTLGTTVTLVAAATPGSTFSGWSGTACSGTAPCTFTPTADTTVTATFAAQVGGLSSLVAMLDFGGQSMLTTSPVQRATLTNNGPATITFNSLTSQSADFAVSHNCASLAAGASCVAQVTFTPNTEGALNGALSIATTTGNSAILLAGVGERSLVTHYYRSILDRSPDAAGKAYWDAEAARVTSLGANVNETWYALAMSFFTSAEYLALGRSPADYVRDLYRTFFNRAPDDVGLAYWSGQLNAGLPREVLLATFMFSPEFANFSRSIFGDGATRAEVAAVVDLYRGLLARLPDSAGFAYWLGQFRAAQCASAAAVYAQVEAMSAAYSGSAEYLARGRNNSQYVGDQYNAFLRRGGDLSGVQFWISQLDTNARTRNTVRQDFIATPEFSARVAAIVNQGCLR